MIGVDMSEYVFTQKLDTKFFEILIDQAARYGYFEHIHYGDEMCGGLWFDQETGKTLQDYDGVAELPKEVITSLKGAGYDVSDLED